MAVADIPNAFVQTDMEGDTVFMKLTGKAAEILYRKFITIEKGKTVLYVEALKAIYGTLRASLLFYKKLVRDLKSIGFVINPYDPCVANKTVDGKQMTVVWHVDDLKISHMVVKEVDNFIQWLRDMYEEEEIGKIKVSCGKIHDYLGMTLDFSSEGEVKIKMVDYVKKMVEAFPEESELIATTPAALHLFEVRDDVKVLKESEAVIFIILLQRDCFYVNAHDRIFTL